MSYLPSFAVIKKALRVNPDLEPGRRTLVSSELLRLLLRIAVTNAAFDEDYYLESNPDVRDGVARGDIFDPRRHYVAYGYFEGRRAALVEVDEAWYLHRYPDVAEAVSSGRVGSATQHYREVGEGEWRIPRPELAEEIRSWAEALGAAD